MLNDKYQRIDANDFTRSWKKILEAINSTESEKQKNEICIHVAQPDVTRKSKNAHILYH